jgi:DNA repair protein RadA/Sms
LTKTKSLFICQECGYESPKWLGRCPDCQQWNTLQEELTVKKTLYQQERQSVSSSPCSILDVTLTDLIRYSTDIGELDRVLGGGIVPGSVILVGGSPGIGKSTILLQVSENLRKKGDLVLYVSGEESVSQTKLRAQRLGVVSHHLYLLSETNLSLILEHIKKLKPKAVIIDSIQIVFKPELTSSPGSVTQVRECAGELVYLGKSTNTALFLVGHVTKEGFIAGPRILEHMVDTVLYFEGVGHQAFRVLRAVKNRFGSTNEIGVFEMTERGLKEIANPSQVFLSERPKNVSGSVVVPIVEGSRAYLIEIQALVSPTETGLPRRRCSGLDYNRLMLLIAVLEKRVGLGLKDQDIYVNVVGGVKTLEPAADLGISIAIASALKEKPTYYTDVILGEVGLSGEIRSITDMEKRIQEARKIGFRRCLLPKNNLDLVKSKENIELIGLEYIKEAITTALT